LALQDTQSEKAVQSVLAWDHRVLPPESRIQCLLAMPTSTGAFYLLTTEHELIEDIKQWTDGRLIGDDCAELPDGLLMTSDSLVEGTHFNLDWTSMSALGWKSCAVNLSDIAAMAGRALYLSVSMTAPDWMNRAHFREFYQSFYECAKTYKAQIAGGDLTKGPVLMIAITAIGHVHENGCLRRSGARDGDVVVVTGDFGASAAGLLLLRAGNSQDDRARYSRCISRHEHPVPRLCESWALVRQTGERGALIDASDGLADALVQIAQASHVAIELDSDLIPIKEETKEIARRFNQNAMDLALYGGEDYELVGTMPLALWNDWQGHEDNPFIKVGTVKSGIMNVALKLSSGLSLPLDLSKCFQQIESKQRD
jgi:thiamine-monophosphate kinase